jgi:diguanylate cyclase
MDVDRFKQFNDTFGHPKGDGVLRQVAALVREHARESDFVARYGGEEFVVILPETDSNGALAVAERIRAAVEGGMWADREVTVSIGAATTEPIVTDAATMVARADTALYEAKHAGRNRVECYRSQVSDIAVGASPETV